MKRMALGILVCVSLIWGQDPPDTIWVWSVPVIDTTVPNTGTPAKVEEAGTLSYENTPDTHIHPTTNTTQSEMSVTVNPLNPNVILVSANTSDYPVTQIYGAGWYLSTDGGSTWIGSDTPPTGFNHGDPATAIGRNGYFYIGCIAADYGQGIMRSTDNGQSWSYFTVLQGTGSRQHSLDKNHLHIDNSETSPYESRLYSGWTDFRGYPESPFPIEVSYSSDYGATWSTPDTISDGLSGHLNQGVNIRTGPNGEVYAVWSVYTTWPDVERKIGFNRSLDGGASWENARAIIDSIKGIRTSSFGPYGIRANSFPSMAVDLSDGPHRGRIYVVWTNRGYPGTNTGDPDIYLIYSDDRGETWSSPIRVNQDPEGNGAYQWFPWITVDNETGIVYVVFYDGRNHIGTNMAEIWVARSTDGGETFEDFPVSDVAFSVGPLPGFGNNYNGDYIGIAASGGRVYPVWNAQVPDANSQAWTSPFTDISVTLLWPNTPGITVEEADTYAIRYNGDAVAGIQQVKAWFSYDGGQTWPDSIRSHPYQPPNYPTHVENDTILWPVTQHPTEHGRVKVVLYDAVNQTAVDISSYDITVRLARPGNVAASVSSNLESVTLTWTDRSNYEDGYIIERKDPKHDWTLLDTLPSNSESFTDNSVQLYKEYLYRIKAFTNSGNTSRTVKVTALTYPSYAVYVPSGSDIHQIHGHGPVFAKYENSYYWVYADGGVIKVRESSDGMTWGEPMVISGSLTNCSSPSITVSEDGIPAVVFKHDKDIYYTYKNSSWSLPKKVNIETPVWMGIPSIAAKSSNDVVVAWVDSVSSSSHTSLKVAEFALGNNITTNTQLTQMGPISDTIARKAGTSPCVLAFNNTFYVFYYDDYNIGYYKSGQEWTHGSHYLTPETQSISDFSASVVAGRIYVVWFEFNEDNYNDNSIQTRKLYASGGLSPVKTVRENITVTFITSFYDTVFMPDVHVFGDGEATFITWEEIDTTYENWLEEAYGANPPYSSPYPPRRIDLTYKATGYDWNQTVELSPATVGHQWSLSPLFTRSRYSFSGYTYHINFVTAGALDLMEYHLRTFLKKQDITIVPASSPLGNEAMVDARLTIEPLASVIKGNRRIGVKLLLPEDCDVSLMLYDPSGREISRIPAHRYENGHHVVYFERKELASGVYFMRADMGDKVITRKFLVLK